MALILLMVPVVVSRGLLTFLLLFFANPVHSAISQQKARVLPFKIWKLKKIEEAQAQVADLKKQTRKALQVKDDSEDPDSRVELAQKLGQAEINLGVARELSANDYFVLYLAPQFKNDSGALLQAAKSLNSKDIAEILLAYEKKLHSSDNYSGLEAVPVPVEDEQKQQKSAKAP